jgi:lipopolysaccharide/colanic/teichoic acid biosynthesis glycosyltransferase
MNQPFSLLIADDERVIREGIQRVLSRENLEIHLAENGLQVWEAVQQRGFDLLLSSVGLLLSAPLWAIVAAAVKLQDGGPVFFPQERWGQHQRVLAREVVRPLGEVAERRFDARPETEGERDDGSRDIHGRCTLHRDAPERQFVAAPVPAPAGSA